MSDSSRARNRLSGEKSPYLLQHATNPVDWYPWSDVAIERARALDRPIFLSIGYSTCHWCHVMERESFESEGIAAYLNEHFVCIKVDREEHPDVDQIYMSAVQRMTGQGGWPMSVFLTTELEPFYAGTYFPPDSRWGRPGFGDLLAQLVNLWTKRRDDVTRQARQVTDLLAQAPAPSGADRVTSRDPVHHAVLQLERGFDAVWGGFGSAPKFPRSMTLMLMLRDRLSRDDVGERRLGMAQKTLEMMWRGGLYDHLAGGFARYSTDDKWLVPHFEKMLYDNALLVLSYLEAWQVEPKEDHRRVIVETLDWVLREMTHTDGGFFSALDADSEGEEGKFCVWTPEEIDAVLGKDDGAFARQVYGMEGAPTFEGAYIPYLPESLDDAAAAAGLTREAFEKRLESVRSRLYASRRERVQPGLDDKVLCSWNGLMIAAMARAGAVMEEPRFVDAARRAAEFLERNLTQGDTDLLRRWRDGDGALAGTLEDYAFSAWGLIELFEATMEPHWLQRAQTLVGRAVELFHDDEAGGFFFTPADTPNLILRTKEPYDGATPSGNSVLVLDLLRLADWLDREDWRQIAERAIAAHDAELERFPMAYPLLLCALDRTLSEPSQIVVAVGSDREMAEAMIRKIRRAFLPQTSLVVVDPANRADLEALIPWLPGKDGVDGRTAAWVCRSFSCQRPVTSVEELELP
ncbi:MAG: thioredoxin domain-containing protein [Planctomycetes bacterium]|nr:thioredoxin domain-containing protein [Planctomycetota bacterium]